MRQLLFILALLLAVTVPAIAQLTTATPVDTSYTDVAGAVDLNSTSAFLTPFSSSDGTKELVVNNVDMYFNGVYDTTKLKFKAGTGFVLNFYGRIFSTRRVSKPPDIHITMTYSATVTVYARKVLAYTGGWAVASSWVTVGSVTHDSRPDTIPTLYQVPITAATDSTLQSMIADSTTGYMQFRYEVKDNGVDRNGAKFKTKMDRVTTGSGSTAATRQRTWQGLANLTWRRDSL